MKKYVQIYLGGTKGREIDTFDLKNKLSILSDNKDIKGIIVGWSLDSKIYKYLKDYTVKNNLELWLWFPIFAELESKTQLKRLETLHKGSVSNFQFDVDENFDFYCPSHKLTYLNIVTTYKENFSSLGFDGVFLDRIRFPSLTVGLEALFSCLCDNCMKFYEMNGLSYSEIKDTYSLIIEQINNIKNDNPFGIRAYYKGHYTFEDKIFEKYINLRMKLITKEVTKICDFFASEGLRVGLDFFPPVLAPFVGQDYNELSKKAEFIKPMLYLNTHTPAALLFELEAIINVLSTNKGAKLIRNKKLYSIIGFPLDKNKIYEFAEREIEAMIYNKETALCHVGLDLHTVKTAQQIGKDEIRKSLHIISKHDVDGMIGSWDILAAPIENIQIFLDSTGEKHE